MTIEDIVETDAGTYICLGTSTKGFEFKFAKLSVHPSQGKLSVIVVMVVVVNNRVC